MPVVPTTNTFLQTYNILSCEILYRLEKVTVTAEQSDSSTFGHYMSKFVVAVLPFTFNCCIKKIMAFMAFRYGCVTLIVFNCCTTFQSESLYYI